MLSRKSPVNTMTVANHCLYRRLFPNKITEPSTVKNLRVVVMMEHGSGPKSLTVRKMKNCPRALANENVINCHTRLGCLCTKLTNMRPSPVMIIATPK